MKLQSRPIIRLLLLTFSFVTCADTRGKKNYIESLENDRFEQTLKLALQPGNEVQLIDQNGAIRPLPLKDSTGAGNADGIDLNNDGAIDIRLQSTFVTRITAWAFTVPADINNDGVADYYLFFTVTNGSVNIKFLAGNSANARQVIFLLDANSQITGIDTNGDNVSDDIRLNGTAVIAPSMVNLPVLAPGAGAFATAQNITITTTTVSAILCYTTDGVTTPACNAAKTGCATGTLYSVPVNISINQNVLAIGCLPGKNDSLTASGAYVIDSTAPTITGAPLSGMFVKPQTVVLTGTVTTGQGSLDGTLIPSEICYTWGSDGSGNPMPGIIPADPAFPCTATNNVVNVLSSSTQLTVGCNTQASVANPATDPNACSFTPGTYHLKYIARDAAGNTTTVQSQNYAVGATPTITTNSVPAKHVWITANSWGNTATAVGSPQISTTWQWQVDFSGTYEIRINDASGNCTGGSLSTGSNNSGAVAALTPITSTILASDLAITLNDIKVCFTPAGGSAGSVTQSVWRIQPLDINATYAKVYYNTGDVITVDVANDILSPIGAIKSITFSSPAASRGADSNNSNTLPIGQGAPNAQGVYNTYQIQPPLTNSVTTLAFDVSITLCDTTGCAAAAVPPTFSTNNNGGTATHKFFILKDKTLGNSVFADSARANDVGDGLSWANAKRTLSAAMSAASGGKTVYVMSGSYCGNGAPPCSASTGTLSVPSGTSVFGSFTSAFYRPDVSANQATVTAGSDANAESVGMQIAAVNVPVSIEGLNITAQRATPDLSTGYNTIGIKATSGTSTLTLYKNTVTAQGDITLLGDPSPGGSYGVYLSSLNAVTLDSNNITAGRGWRGANGGLGGANGSPGVQGSAGAGGAAGCSICANDSTSHASGGTGGNGGLGAFNRGGNGGAGGWQTNGDGTPNAGQSGGYDGETAPNGGGGGGIGGTGTTGCTGNAGGAGAPGSSGSPGSNGAAPGATYGFITGGFLLAHQGSTGADGTDGRGGGGGGGGGNAEGCLSDGGSGGSGGGGGGGKATGGEGGQAGGSSVTVFFSNVASITLTSNTMTRNLGGDAGNGKNGGTGGTFGPSRGGTAGSNEGGAGGLGADGGIGGNGGHGAGGNGGPSFGLVIFPNISPTCAGNVYAGGGGGAGGSSTGNFGSAGANINCFRFTSLTAGSSCTCN